MNYLQLTKKVIFVAASLSLILPLVVQAGDPEPSKPPSNVAVVNGKDIGFKDFERRLQIIIQREMHGQPGQLPEAWKDRAKNEAVNSLIAEELEYQEGVKQKLKLADGLVEKRLKTLKESFDSDAQYRETLKRMELTEDHIKEQITRQALIQKLEEKELISKVELTKEDAKKYFTSNPADFHLPERVRAQHILIKVDPAADEKKKAEARNKLEGIKKRILAGEDFGKLAKEFSEDRSNAREGDLGYFARGQLPAKSFEDVAYKLAPNEISDIVETQFGYHLIKVLDHQAAKDPSFEEVETRAMAILRYKKIYQKREAYIFKLRQDAKIETLIK